jgi:DNA polymerase-3 subunit epsilon
MEEIAVLDFETTGLSPGQDRPTEIAIALVREGVVIDRFQSLMNPGRWIASDVAHLTGITNDLVADAPPVHRVMREAARFVSGRPLVAHNAAFDRGFWTSELQRLGLASTAEFACTMLLARRLYPDAPNHRLGTLAAHLGLRDTGRAHRALADVLMTVQLWQRIRRDIATGYALEQIGHRLLCQVQRRQRAAVPRFLTEQADRARRDPAQAT